MSVNTLMVTFELMIIVSSIEAGIPDGLQVLALYQLPFITDIFIVPFADKNEKRIAVSRKEYLRVLILNIHLIILKVIKKTDPTHNHMYFWCRYRFKPLLSSTIIIFNSSHVKICCRCDNACDKYIIKSRLLIYRCQFFMWLKRVKIKLNLDSDHQNIIYLFGR